MKNVIIVPAILALSACTTTTNSPARFYVTAPGVEELKSDDHCCSQLNTIHYQPVTRNGEHRLSIALTSPKVVFKSGRSFVEGIQLPASLTPISFSVHSNITTSAFVPSILVLDDQYQPLDVIDEQSIHYQAQGLLNSARYTGDIELNQRYKNGKSPAYLVVFTTKEAIETESPVGEPSDMAMRSGDIQANIAHNTDYSIPHSTIGNVYFTFNFEALATPASEELREERINDTVTKKDALATPHQTAESEENVYTELVENAVKSGNFSTALAYVEESERLAISGVRATFIQAMKQYEEADN
ncbi:hypothetical protein DS893_08445 [Vibrionales bacterium C3R12]|nr:hypothetical protein DS893_08445 [Vibrionales bacterium C3R12]